MGPARLTKIGKYEILDVIGRGGMGVVYKAVDPAIGRLVAIKMITGGFSDDPNLLKRFYREAQSTGALQHPNIVTVYDLGDDAGTPYLVMEYLEGETLEAVIRSHREMLLAEKLSVMVMACDGLDYAHRRNVVHRDIKPANLILPKDGGLKIVDFGIARFGNERFTRTGQVMGSIYYMSPEQINGEESDAGTDIYSTGVVLFEFLTGELPFRGKDTASALLKILRDPAPLLSTYLREYPAELDQMLARALAKSRRDRYPTIEEFAFDLERLQEESRRKLIGGYLRSAELSIEQSEWDKAKDNLRQVLKLDRQNTRANELARLVQSRIQKQQTEDQVRQFRARAEEALRLRQWEDAILSLEQAIELEPNPEIAHLRDSIRQRRWDLTQAIARAERAHRAGEFEAAQRAIADALRLDPSDTQAKALKTIITKELADRAKREQVENLMAEAHREISAQKFTAALELLNQAHAIDPAAAAVEQLAAFISTAQQQQIRKQAVEKLTADIEGSLNRDEFGNAVSKADQALRQFPNDPALMRLREFAEKQRDIWSRRIHIESQIAVAREMLEAGNASGAADVLKAALMRNSGDVNLTSLLNIVNQALSEEEARSQAARKKKEDDQQIQSIMARARELEAEDVEKALGILEQALPLHPNHAQLEVYAAVLRETVARDKLERDRAEAEARRRREAIETEIKAARGLLDADQPGDALRRLTEALRRYPDTEDLASCRRTIETVIAEQKAEQNKERELELEAQKREEIQAALTHGRSLLTSGMAHEAKQVAHEALEKLGDVPALLALLSDATMALRVEAEASKVEEPPSGSTFPPASATLLFGQGSPAPDPSETLAHNRTDTALSDPTAPRSAAATPRLARETRPQYAQQEVPIRATRANKTVLTIAGVVAAVLLITAVLFLVQPKSTLVHFDIAPSGTTISVAGKHCASPCDFELKPGDYQVQAGHEGYASLNRLVEVKAGQSNRVSFALERASIAASSNPVTTPPRAGSITPPSPISLPARLEISNALPGAEVYLDDRKLGRIDGRGNLVASVEPGNHQVRILEGNSAHQSTQYFSRGNVVAIDRSPVVRAPSQPPQIQQQADLAEWQQIKNSQDADQVSQFLRRYPDSVFKGQALDQLENIYWTKAIASDTSAALSDYLARYPHGSHSQAATAELAKLDWQGIGNSRDETLLENYLNRYPRGPYRDQAWDRLNDVVWEKTNRTDPGALRNYLQQFPGGKYAAEASRELTVLINRTQSNPQPAAATPDESRPTLFADDQAAILEVLSAYDRSIETSDLAGMRKVWPNIPADTVKNWMETFNLAKNIKVSVNVTSGPVFKGSVATVKASQVISFVANGNLVSKTPNITVKLKKSDQNVWYIDSIK